MSPHVSSPQAPRDDNVNKGIVAVDGAEPFVAINLTGTLDLALEKLEAKDFPELPVIGEKGLLLGFIQPSRIVGEYRWVYLKKERGRCVTMTPAATPKRHE